MNCYRDNFPCEDPISPLGGAVIPEGYTAELAFIDGVPTWVTDPAQPPEELPILLVNQNDGGILIDENLFISL